MVTREQSLWLGQTHIACELCYNQTGSTCRRLPRPLQSFGAALHLEKGEPPWPSFPPSWPSMLSQGPAQAVHTACWQQIESEPAACPGSQRGQPSPGLHQPQHCLLDKGRACPTLLCTGTNLSTEYNMLQREEIKTIRAFKGGEGAGERDKWERSHSLPTQAIQWFFHYARSKCKWWAEHTH